MDRGHKGELKPDYLLNYLYMLLQELSMFFTLDSCRVAFKCSLSYIYKNKPDLIL